ncbi:hypothetical protein [Pseudomonas rhizosphaerae]|uniref:hypothetical protein n=1 Tax=Pseudomonas rhizosphaerae TaxID=216142 RepID=UPI002B467BA0|nr:hypothetical protein [Pseudomonas rhizosphaerae]MEB2870844.1 hypothetical protein [Pseudomonas rhizosphaerae]
MIAIEQPIPEPEGFDSRCRKRGTAWLAKNASPTRPADYWSEFRLDLAEGFKNRCGYGGMWISSGTVDHFASCDERRDLSYEWSNFRYLDGWINSSKKNKKSSELLDPYIVEDGWFEIILPSLQLVLTDAIPPELRSLAEATLKNLPLAHDERLVRNRRAWLKEYEQGNLSLQGLKNKAPLIAKAVLKRLSDRPESGEVRAHASSIALALQNASFEAQAVIREYLRDTAQVHGPACVKVMVWAYGEDTFPLKELVDMGLGLRRGRFVDVVVQCEGRYPLDTAFKAAVRAAEVLSEHLGHQFHAADGRD